MQDHSLKGSLFENLMIAEYVKQMHHQDNLQDIWFWRESSGHEVDLLVETENGFNVAEFKSSMTVMPDMFKPMQKFEKISGWADLKKNLIYTGVQSQKRSYRNAVPWNKFGLLY